MDRREAIGHLVAGAGIGSMVKVIEPEPKPLLFVLTLPPDYPIVDCVRVQAEWEALWKGSPPAPLIMIEHGCDLKAIVDPREQERPCNWSPTGLLLNSPDSFVISGDCKFGANK